MKYCNTATIFHFHHYERKSNRGGKPIHFGVALFDMRYRYSDIPNSGGAMDVETSFDVGDFKKTTDFCVRDLKEHVFHTIATPSLTRRAIV